MTKDWKYEVLETWETERCITGCVYCIKMYVFLNYNIEMYF